MRRAPRMLSGLLLASLSVAAGSSAAEGGGKSWSQDGPVNVRVNQHAFHRALVDASGCEVRVALYFDAPADQYAEKNPVRNYHRFRARLKLSDGKSIDSRIFGNPTPGRRVYRFTHDTSADGCWSKDKHKLYNLEVNACRTRNCKVAELD